MAEMFLSVWEMFETVGFSVNDMFVSLADIFVFVVIGGLFITLIVWLIGGND